jgi:hypothetical protein
MRALPLTLTLLLCSAPALSQPAPSQQQKQNPIESIADWWKSITAPKPPEPEKLGARNTITVNPLALQNEQLGVEYELAFGKVLSVYVAPQIAWGATQTDSILSAGGSLGVRFFLLGAAPNGIFFGPEIAGTFERIVDDGILRRGFGLGLGAGVGWTLVFFDRFVLSVGFSAQYLTSPDLRAPPEEEELITQFRPLPRFAFGVAF